MARIDITRTELDLLGRQVPLAPRFEVLLQPPYQPRQHREARGHGSPQCANRKDLRGSSGSHKQPLETLNVRPTLQTLEEDWRTIQEVHSSLAK